MTAYTVVRESHDVPCDHPMCEVFHKNLDPGHEVTRRYWLVLANGVRVGELDPFDTKREALAAAAVLSAATGIARWRR